MAARTGARTGLSPPAPASDSGAYIRLATEGNRFKHAIVTKLKDILLVSRSSQFINVSQKVSVAAN